MIRVASSLFTPTLTTGVCHHVVVPRRRRGADVSAAVRRAGSPNRDGNPRAGSGPPFLPPPCLLSVCLFCCRLFFVFSFALALLYQKKPAKYASFNFCSKIDCSLRAQSSIFCAFFFFLFFSCLGSSASPMFFSAGAINLISRCVHLATMTRKSPSLSSASEHYVGV